MSAAFLVVVETTFIWTSAAPVSQDDFQTFDVVRACTVHGRHSTILQELLLSGRSSSPRLCIQLNLQDLISTCTRDWRLILQIDFRIFWAQTTSIEASSSILRVRDG